MMVMDALDMSNQGLSATKGIGENFGSLRPTRPGVHGGNRSRIQTFADTL